MYNSRTFTAVAFRISLQLSSKPFTFLEILIKAIHLSAHGKKEQDIITVLAVCTDTSHIAESPVSHQRHDNRNRTWPL